MLNCGAVAELVVGTVGTRVADVELAEVTVDSRHAAARIPGARAECDIQVIKMLASPPVIPQLKQQALK